MRVYNKLMLRLFWEMDLASGGAAGPLLGDRAAVRIRLEEWAEGRATAASESGKSSQREI
jgi:hypothetical protein